MAYANIHDANYLFSKRARGLTLSHLTFPIARAWSHYNYMYVGNTTLDETIFAENGRWTIESSIEIEFL